MSTWIEYSYLHEEYLAYMARIFFKDFVLLTKIQLTTHAHTVVVLKIMIRKYVVSGN